MKTPNAPGWWAFEGKWKTYEKGEIFLIVCEVKLFNGELWAGIGNDWEPVDSWLGEWTRVITPWDIYNSEDERYHLGD